MLFAGKITILILCLCATFEYNLAQDSTSVFHCDFDEKDVCGFVDSDGSAHLSIEKGIKWDYPNDEPPSRPLSDVTSTST